MKNPELFYKTIKILADAYRNDTLIHSNCSACAIGNIIASNNGYTPHKSGNFLFNGSFVDSSWMFAFCTDGASKKQSFNEPSYLKHQSVRSQIDSTGYSLTECARIEHAFEVAPRGKNNDDWMFNGLMAVVDVLMQIHECNEVETETKKQFELIYQS